MKRSIIMMLFAVMALTSCSLFQSEYTIDEIIAEKEKIDGTENPAKKFLIKNELQEEGYLTKNIVVLKNVLVKDIIPSTNIDYEFCVLSDIDTKKGKVECFIYTKNISRIAKLEKGKSIIDVEGQFGRFFSLLDEYYTKLEIVKSAITIRNK